MLAAAILAAGESRRMGSPKALTSIHGKTFVQHLLDATRHPRIGITQIVLGAHADQIRALLGAPSASVVINEEWQSGQLSSIQAAVRSLSDQPIEGLILCPVDHPIISAALIANLIAAFDSSHKLIALPTFRGRRGHPVIFHRSLYAELLAASPEIGARQIVRAHPGEIIEVPTDQEGVILNLDDPDTLQAARNTKGDT
jgi:molybdenum cofactor cytidylyltransferase